MNRSSGQQGSRAPCEEPKADKEKGYFKQYASSFLGFLNIPGHPVPQGEGGQRTKEERRGPSL